MLKNYFKIGFRNLRRHKGYAFINILGLALGLACSIIIFTLVSYHLSFDQFHKNKDRIFRVVTDFHYDEIEHQSGVPQPFGEAFRNDYSFVEKAARVMVYSDPLLSTEDGKDIKKFTEKQGIAFAEPEFFDVFNFPLSVGDARTILKDPNNAIITENVATKYFGNANAVGKMIRYTFSSGKIDFRVAGILKDIPGNTDRKQEIYVSYANLKDRDPRIAADDSWGSVSSSMQCFVLLRKGTTKADAEKVFPSFNNKYFTPDDAKGVEFKLQPLSDIHFNTDYDGYATMKYLWALVFVGIFLLITACVNFINLATAQALNRSKEVGIRKVMGSLRFQLFWQFIAETTLITLVALVIAFIAAKATIPYLNQLFEIKMGVGVIPGPQLLLFILIVALAVIFLSGSYPGLVLANFRPVLALKKSLSQKSIGGFSLRRILVVSQFAISQTLIIGTIIIASQMHYTKTADLGFKKDGVVMMPVPSTDSLGKIKMQLLRDRIQQVPGVEDVSLCMEAPAAESNHWTDIHFEDRPKAEPFEINVKESDNHYLSLFGIQLVTGRNLFPSDTIKEFLVNETMVNKLGFKDPHDILNKEITVNGKKRPIVGVIKDFYNQSFHSSIDPICILSLKSYYKNCAVKINLSKTGVALASFEKIWSDMYPDYLYSYQFIDERIAKFYSLDNILLKLIEAFALIAILIGCLGLYGLVSFMALQKTKEIGVRKVLGAGVGNILWLFGKEFTRLLLLAFVIAAPIAWWAMNKYLQDFKYRIPIGFGIFIIAILSTFIIAALTVGYRSMKASFANPVKSLRSE